DVLAATDSITIVAEQTVQISFVLAAREDTALDALTTVSSHPHAQAQVQGWLREQVHGAHIAAASSTAAAARELAAADADEARGRAAVCSPLAAEHFGLTVLADGIEDYDGAITRFVLVTREGRIPARTGADKTTLVLQLPHNRSGALLEALEILASNGVNMSRIESRPVGDFLGRYSFSLDLEGHIEDRRVAAALRALHRLCPVVHYLGSYPRVDPQRPDVREDYADAAYDDARAWIERLTGMITPTDPGTDIGGRARWQPGGTGLLDGTCAGNVAGRRPTLGAEGGGSDSGAPPSSSLPAPRRTRHEHCCSAGPPADRLRPRRAGPRRRGRIRRIPQRRGGAGLRSRSRRPPRVPAHRRHQLPPHHPRVPHRRSAAAGPRGRGTAAAGRGGAGRGRGAADRAS